MSTIAILVVFLLILLVATVTVCVVSFTNHIPKIPRDSRRDSRRDDTKTTTGSTTETSKTETYRAESSRKNEKTTAKQPEALRVTTELSRDYSKSPEFSYLNSYINTSASYA